ncbi:DNA cytosine methyltransferase [Enterobacter hormaechei]|uniref:Cytosine-specific methyltransferase n=1 Tax=Enterobacter hormaechei TaxID=158836 RepID=A0A9X7Q4N1_9ENTR|nr:DNA cytosine methyltransferase [Enterobacter hormaechei]PXB36463.1 DNA (cytosine-5-)-methyltransferase [Enterobacter hormaechei]
MEELQPVIKELLEKSKDIEKLRQEEDLHLLKKVLEIYDQKVVAEVLRAVSGSDWSREAINRWVNGKLIGKRLVEVEVQMLRSMLPSAPAHYEQSKFRFIDLFAGIGGIRSGFEAIGGKCVFTSEWNEFAVKTYKANWYCDENEHVFNSDIRDITLSNNDDITEEEAYASIDKHIPDHDVLLAGFPCQPFSLAGVSKKNSLGRKHGFECDTQGTLFFDVARIIMAKKPSVFVLENVKNLKSHDKGKTFRIIMQTLDELGYDVADADTMGSDDPKIIDGKNFLPQHRERIVLVGFRRDLNLSEGFTLRDIVKEYPPRLPAVKDLLDKSVDEKYTLTPKLWDYLYKYAKKHKEKGNGFGYGLVNPDNKSAVCRTLSARYHKDGSEILIDRGWDYKKGEDDFFDAENLARRPRRLTPRECARIMGFEQPGKVTFRIPVSDTQAYRQFGNSVVVPVFAAVARLLKSRIERAVLQRETDSFNEAV